MVSALQPVSFAYNEGDGRTRYGFIAEDAAAVDAHLSTYNASSTITGIDDRSILAVVVGALKELWIRAQDYFVRTERLEDDVALLKARVTQLEFQLAGAAASSPTKSGNVEVVASSSLVLNGNTPAMWSIGEPWSDNLGALFIHDGQSETIYSTSTIDSSIAGTTTIEYWAQTPAALWLHSTRDIVIPQPANDNAILDEATTTAAAL